MDERRKARRLRPPVSQEQSKPKAPKLQPKLKLPEPENNAVWKETGVAVNKHGQTASGTPPLKTEAVLCEVLTTGQVEGKPREFTVGFIRVYEIPHVGAALWFTKPRQGARAWRVTYVAHWVGDGEFESKPYQHIAIYAEPLLEDVARAEFFGEGQT